MDAIHSLIPGTKHYYHLYFLNLAKQQKKIEDFTEEEAELYLRFDEQHSGDALFAEVETWLKLINPLEKLPAMSEATSQEDAKEYSDIIDLITAKYVRKTGSDHMISEMKHTAEKFL